MKKKKNCSSAPNVLCTVGKKRKRKKKRNTPINSNPNRREMKLVPINMDYSLLLIDAFKFSLGVHLHGGSLPNLSFFNINPRI